MIKARAVTRVLAVSAIAAEAALAMAVPVGAAVTAAPDHGPSRSSPLRPGGRPNIRSCAAGRSRSVVDGSACRFSGPAVAPSVRRTTEKTIGGSHVA